MKKIQSNSWNWIFLGVAVRIAGDGDNFMHHKFCLIDVLTGEKEINENTHPQKGLLINGSMNWTHNVRFFEKLIPSQRSIANELMIHWENWSNPCSKCWPTDSIEINRNDVYFSGHRTQLGEHNFYIWWLFEIWIYERIWIFMEVTCLKLRIFQSRWMNIRT